MDDKTTKIPSLKEFQQSQTKHGKDKSKGTARAASKQKRSDSKRTAAEDTHRVDIKGSKAKSSRRPAADRTREYRGGSEYTSRPTNPVSGSTQRIDSDRIRRQVSSEYRPQSRQQSKPRAQRPPQQSLMQTRRAGQRPPQQGSQGQRPPQQRVPQRDAQRQRQAQNRTLQPKKRKKPLSPFARKVRRVLVYILIVAGFLVAGVILSLTVLFKTENIVVNIPQGVYNSQDIISASGLSTGENIFIANKTAAEQKLMEKFPYIKSAEVKAVIPDTISIDIVLSDPAFAVKTDKLTYIANEDSKVLEVTATADEADVPLIEGVTVADAKAGETLEFESEFVKASLGEMFNFAKEKEYKNITRVDIDTQTTLSGTQTIEIRYVYDDRIVVYLGLPENISYKMETAQKIITEKLDVNNTGVLTGELDVSMSYDTKKSYFNQYTLIPDAVITEPATEAETTAADEYY